MVFTLKNLRTGINNYNSNKSISQTNEEHNRTRLDMNFIKDYTTFGQ
jgi:hypothetical protein